MFLATVSEDYTAKIWEMTDGQCKTHLIHDYFENTLESGAILRDVAFSPDGRYLVTSGRFESGLEGMWDSSHKSGIATLWDISDGFKIAHYLPHKLEVRAVMFSPDGRYLATASNDWTASIWEVSSGYRLATLAHEKAVHAVVFSHDGNYLATASWDGTAGIWEVPSGRQLARVTHENRVYTAIFSQDDTYLITASEDGTARAWLWKPQDMINEASSRLTYDLTEAEWRVYMGDEPYRKTRYCPLQELPKFEENQTVVSGEGVASLESDEMGIFIAHIRSGHPRRADIEGLKQYGIACLERLIKETKFIRSGDTGTARDEVFTAINYKEAAPIIERLIRDKDQDIRCVASLSLRSFKYQNEYSIGGAIGTIEYAFRRIRDGEISEGDRWRLDDVIRILRERQEKEFKAESEGKVRETDTQTPAKWDEENQFQPVQEKQELAPSTGDGALLTEQAKQAILSADIAARRFNHNYIDTEHLLLGLLDEPSGGVGKLLNELGIEPENVRSALEFIIGRGDRNVLGEIGLTPRAKKVLELASHEAHLLNHRFVGTEHLLLGVVSEGDGIAAGILNSLGINLEKVRTRTIQLLNQSE
jgi:hypothetical protein